MVCINCFHKKTATTNSRRLKRGYEVWRRHECPNCGSLFTTREKPDLSGCMVLASESGDTPYDKARLTISLVRIFDIAGISASDAYWLVETIEKKLIDGTKRVSKLPIKIPLDTVVHTTYETLANYHPVAGLAYGSAHGIVTPTNKRHRGRPGIEYKL